MTVTYAWTARDVVTVVGPDAAAYLQGQLSQDIANLPIGEATSTFVLAPQGKVDGWGRIHRTDEDRFEIDVDAGAGQAWDGRLRRFLLRTKAEISVAPGVRTLSVRGAVAFGGMQAPGLGVVGSDVVGVVEGEPVALPPDAVEALPEQLEAQRIRAGVPRWNAELDADTIPATLGQWVIDSSVSFTKGCYTGQELVARIDSRGGNVPRHLQGLVVDGPPPVPGSDVTLAGESVGTVTSSAADAVGTVALAFIARRVEVGADGVAVEVGGVPALLHRLPLA